MQIKCHVASQQAFGFEVEYRFPSSRSLASGARETLMLVQGLLEIGGLEASFGRAAKMWCWKGQVSSGTVVMSPEALEEFVWQEFFSDPTQWWNNRWKAKNRQHSDFTHAMANEPLWLNCSCKPAWVNSQLPMWDAGPPASPSTSEDDLEVEKCSKLCEDGQIREAVDALRLLVQRGCRVSNNLFYRVLKGCITHKDLGLGTQVHALTVTSGYQGDAFLATHLIGLYASHGKLDEAMQVFSKVTTPSAYNWSSIILAYARHGQPTQAIGLYGQMRKSCVKPDNRIFVAVLKACASAGDLAAGKHVHAHILASEGQPDIFVQNCLVDMYAKCGSLEDSRRVFDTLPHKDVVTWNAMIAGYAHQGMGQEALNLYTSMQRESIAHPSPVTFVSLLQACASLGVAALDRGKQLHAQIEQLGVQGDVGLGASLVNMYAKCGSLEDARRVFEKCREKNVMTWTAMIAGYSQQGLGHEALSLYDTMQQEGVTLPNSVTFICLLQACASVGVAAVQKGKQLHAQVKERGLQTETDVVVGNSLVNMYAKCGSVEDAQALFDRLSHKDVVTWNAMIAGYAHRGMGEKALCLYTDLQREGITRPNSVTFVCLLQACASVAALALGKQLHAQIEELGIQGDVVVGTSLVNMYAKCGSVEDAQRLFDRLPQKNVVTWNGMIAGYAQQGMGEEALKLYNNMLEEGITAPDAITFACLLQACASVGATALHQGKQLHAQIEEQGLHDDVVVGNSLISMYVKCGSLEDARRLFDRLAQRDVVTWTAMLTGYSQQGMGEEALSFYSSMQQEGISPPDSATFVCLLQACASFAALPLGKELHAQLEQQGLQADVVVGPSLVNMYAKCGSLEDAQRVFDSLPEKDIAAWGALIAGYARQGDSEVVFDLVDRMREVGMEQNSYTFLSVLTVCSYAGLVDEGRKYFEVMSQHLGITPTIKHYTCMMDLLARAGHLDEAFTMVTSMPFQPDIAVWLTLLGACRKWGNVEVGRQAFEFAVRLDEKKPAAYALMANIYDGAEMWEEAKETQARRVKCGAWKEPGQSWWTDMGGVVHSFVVGDRKRPESEVVYVCTTGTLDPQNQDSRICSTSGVVIAGKSR